MGDAFQYGFRQNCCVAIKGTLIKGIKGTWLGLLGLFRQKLL